MNGIAIQDLSGDEQFPVTLPLLDPLVLRDGGFGKLDNEQRRVVPRRRAGDQKIRRTLEPAQRCDADADVAAWRILTLD
jgi:hypothetical protein